jgi:hypothetical protein
MSNKVEYITTPLKVALHLSSSEPLWGDSVTHIELDDELGGAFVVLKQWDSDGNEQSLRLDMEELELVTFNARQMIEVYDRHLALSQKQGQSCGSRGAGKPAVDLGGGAVNGKDGEPCH